MQSADFADPDAIQEIIDDLARLRARQNPDELQALLDELDGLRTREIEIILQICTILQTESESVPDAAPTAVPTIHVRISISDSEGTSVYRRDRVRFTGTARTRAGTGRVLGWTNSGPNPYIRIRREFPFHTRVIGSAVVLRRSQSITLIERHIRRSNRPAANS